MRNESWGRKSVYPASLNTHCSQSEREGNPFCEHVNLNKLYLHIVTKLIRSPTSLSSKLMLCSVIQKNATLKKIVTIF